MMREFMYTRTSCLPRNSFFSWLFQSNFYGILSQSTQM